MRTIEHLLQTLAFLAAAVVGGLSVSVGLVDLIVGREALGGAFLLGGFGLLTLVAILDTLRKVKEKLEGYLDKV